MAGTISNSAPIDAPERRRLPILLRRAWFSLNQAFRRRIAHTGVTPDQFTTLRTLLENEARRPTQSELTRLLASDPNTVGSLLERMAAAGWIARAPHEKDQRARRVSLTPAGRKKYLQARKIAVALQTELLAAWPERRREEFLENLQTLADRCRAMEDPPKKRARQKAGY
ncbi:MAG: MarR family winged helix-turn-helix transcriptional regulator [Verrucomicrobiota bacterium]|jgi:DNA-binding MarR family transcriptional regulator